MSERIVHAQQFATPQEALAHYGVKGMQWGVRKADILEGVSAKTNKEAAKDAAEFARAKMFYGEGAGNRRKLIKAKVESKSAKDPNYKKAFDHHMAKQDLGKHAEKARGERKRKDISAGTGKAVRGAHRQLTGGMGTVGLTGALLAGGVVAARRANIDQIIRDSATTRVRDAQRSRSNRRAVNDLLRDMGMS